ncbi:hypothetical protein M408DRAFT_125001 [Serendipita vermifera MAFF 305830]|uniref:Uncharacterized protein n=1 Tax=Serendipita vermifera MAFF 305830 TaxID=933852 RepID=A0A0C3AN29_SERVB|nr:hypothetical protein M408DRAFT_125001 [Serendipita vermifera MAFF 305830]
MYISVAENYLCLLHLCLYSIGYPKICKIYWRTQSKYDIKFGYLIDDESISGIEGPLFPMRNSNQSSTPLSISQ